VPAWNASPVAHAVDVRPTAAPTLNPVSRERTRGPGWVSRVRSVGLVASSRSEAISVEGARR